MEKQQTKNEAAGGLSGLTVVLAEATKNQNRCVVRLRTSMWSDKAGIHTKKSLMFLRRQCDGFNVLEEDSDATGAEYVLPRILNLGECEDGVYEVVTCNERHDFETGHVDDYDYRLVPHNAELRRAADEL